MEKQKVIENICKCGIVAVVRSESEEQAVKIADACATAGVAALEITFTIPGAAEVIKKLAITDIGRKFVDKVKEARGKVACL